MRYLAPLVVFLIMSGFLARGLWLDPRELPSALLDKPAPKFSIPVLTASTEGAVSQFSPDDMLGQVWILNVWASWCGACTIEHPVIERLASQQLLPIIGLNYKDQDLAAQQWLNRFGDPYTHVPVDADGKVGIDWGVYGVPETFVMDKSGNVRYKHVGPVDQEAIDQTILPLVKRLQESPT